MFPSHRESAKRRWSYVLAVMLCVGVVGAQAQAPVPQPSAQPQVLRLPQGYQPVTRTQPAPVPAQAGSGVVVPPAPRQPIYQKPNIQKPVIQRPVLNRNAPIQPTVLPLPQGTAPVAQPQAVVPQQPIQQPVELTPIAPQVQQGDIPDPTYMQDPAQVAAEAEANVDQQAQEPLPPRPRWVPASAATQKDGKMTEVELRALNKVTAISTNLKGPIVTPQVFGNLVVTVQSCWSSPPDSPPEHAALVEIVEAEPGEKPETIFTGWIFSASPGLSALEHPIYDLTLIACRN